MQPRARMGNNGRHGRDNNQGCRSHDRDREFEDRDEGNRTGDHPPQMQRDRYATGQSGYSSGRSGQDPSLDYQNRNAGYSRGGREDRQVFGTDDRFTGRSGSQDYTASRAGDADRIGQRDSYGDRNYDQSFGHRDDVGRGIYDHRGDDRSFRSRDYAESERGTWSTNTQRPGEHRGKGPRGYTRSDERIKEMVCEVLTEDAHIDASGIDVEVKSGEVILSGMVPNRRMKRMAEDALEGIGGIKDVSNQLKISDDERQMLGRADQAGNQNGNGVVGHEETRKDGDKKARA